MRTFEKLTIYPDKHISYFKYMDLSLESKNLVSDYLDISSLVQLAETCLDTRDNVTTYLHRRVVKILSHFKLDWVPLLPVMKRYKAVIGGLCALKAIVPAAWPFQLETNSLYFYLPKDFALLFVQELKGFGEFGVIKDGNVWSDDNILTEHVWSLRDESIGREEPSIFLHVVSSISDNPLPPIFLFNSTHTMNFISSSGIFVGYSALSSAGKGLANYNTGEDLEGQKVQHLTTTHATCGFTVSSRLSSLISEDHICGLDFSCPLTIRSTIDGGTLFAPIDPTHPLRRGDMNIGALMWSIGAPPCHFSDVQLESFIQTAKVVPEYTYW